MAFRFSSSSTSTPLTSYSSSRPIKSPKYVQAKANSSGHTFSVPGGPNWVYASGGSRSVRFDFTKALDEQIAFEDETCGSSQEYYARKSATTSKSAGSFAPPTLPAYKTDPRFLYPTQRPNYAFNFDRATPADIENMNTALPFGPMSPPERKQKSRKDIDKVPRPSLPSPNAFEFGNKSTSFSANVSSSRTTKTSAHVGLTTLTARSQNHDGHAHRTSSSGNAHITVTRRK